MGYGGILDGSANAFPLPNPWEFPHVPTLLPTVGLTGSQDDSAARGKKAGVLGGWRSLSCFSRGACR